MDVSGFPSLNDIGDENPNNHILSWADTTDPGSHQQAMIIATILNNRDQYGDSVSQLCYRLVVTYCIVYYYTKRATLARLLANEGPAIYVVHLNRYFCYTSMILFSSHFL